MPHLASWLARLCVCAVVTAPLFSAPALAERRDDSTYQQRVVQYQQRNAERMKQTRAVTGGPEQIIKARTAATADKASLECLTEAVYFESRGEPISGSGGRPRGS